MRRGLITALLVILIVTIPSAGITALKDGEGDLVQFGASANPQESELKLARKGEQFQEGSEVWVRVQLKGGFGESSVTFVLEELLPQGEPTWTARVSWMVAAEPNYSVYLGKPPELQGLPVGEYRLAVVTGATRRAEGEFQITAKLGAQSP
ncbi:MAG: hypothetical protein EXR48_04725 [Dehalococcoidia bacterium]|nr:hypothetical protein [Dehalococcoidia bacterium]